MGHMITESDIEQTKKDGKEKRKTLAVDPVTYDLLMEICDIEDRTIIDQLKRLIRNERIRLAGAQEHESV